MASIDVKGLLRQINDDVAHLPDGAMRALAPALVQAQRELQKQLTVVLSKHRGDRWTAQHLRNALTQVQSAITALDQAGARMGQVLVSQTDVVRAAAQRHLVRELQQFTTHFGDSIIPIPLVQASQVAQSALLDRYAASVRGWSAQTRGDIRHQLALGLVRHETFEQMKNRLLGVGNIKRFGAATPAIQAQVISKRMWKTLEYQARRIVRTEVINAYNEIKSQDIASLHSEFPQIMQRWDAAIDARTCPMCRELDHVVVPVGKYFPGGIAHPPLHPFCRCAVVVWKKGWDEAGPVKMHAGVSRKAAEPRGRAPAARRPAKSLK